ncbi:RNA-directed DNA polymerase from mobile element jockey [Trichonephila clavipes]|nr:RNA-directed DNA polymerase from mobile element jockey [Trichonephila clavipes]
MTFHSTPPSVLACLRMIPQFSLQGVQLKYTIKNIQHFLDKLETWLTHWRIAINVDKTQAIVFRKWGVIDPPFQLTLFDDYIQWVPVVKYLGLHIDSRLTFKKHIDYLSEKFWGRISLAISLVGRRSPLSLENKVILYKQILRPVITYGSPVWSRSRHPHEKVQFDPARGRVRPRCVFRSTSWITMDMSATRTDVASSVEVSALFALETMSFDVMAATDLIDNCTTCAESEDLCGVLDEILFTLEDVDAEAQITPERLRLVNLVQWAALKCSRRSIRLQNAEFKKYIREVELSRRTPTAASPASQQKRPLAKRQPASPQKDVPSKKQAKSERKLPRTSASPRHIEDSSSMEEGGIVSRRELGRDRFS